MKKMIRIILVATGMILVIAAGLQRTAWADKLADGQQPDAKLPVSPALAANRPHGSVETTQECIKTLVPGRFTVGSIAEWVLENVAHGKLYEACIAKQSDLPAALPGVLLSAPIRLIVHTDPAMTVDQRVCFPVLPGKKASAYYWDSKAWVETEEAENGQACVTVPALAKAPTYVGVCEEP